MGNFQNIDEMLNQALSAIEKANNTTELENIRVSVLGKNGSFTLLS